MTGIRADLQKTDSGRAVIRLECGTQNCFWAGNIPGARRGASGAWTMPATLDTCEALRRQRVPFTPGLHNFEELAGRIHRFVEAQKVDEDPKPVKPVPIRAPYHLYKHQIRAYNIALALRGAALLMDMGTGKTLATVAVTGRRFLDGTVRRVLIVAPASVCAVWPQEYQRFADFPVRVALLLGDHAQRVRALERLCLPALPGEEDPLRVAVINYESAWRLRDGNTDYLKAFRADMVVADESQRIKSPTAKQSKAMWALGGAAPYRMILTGTPIQKDTRDIWSQYRFLDPGIFPISYGSFQARYAIMGGFEGRQYLGGRNVDELTRKTHAVGYRVRKEECLDLPPKMYEDLPVALGPGALRVYRQLTRESVAALEGGEVTAAHVLVRMLRLQQLAGGFLRDDDGQLHTVHTAKLDALQDILENLRDEGKKAVVFCRFLAEMDAIGGMCGEMGIGLVRIDGGVKAGDRGALVARFQTDPACMVFLGEIDACAEGLTLTAAQTVIYYSLTWNLAKYQQSADRVHRIGQTGACTYIHLIAPGTIDDTIMRALKAKEDLARSVVDNWRSIIQGEEGEA